MLVPTLISRIENPEIIPSWSDSTDEEILYALNRYYAGTLDLTKYWSVGDKRTVHLDKISDITGLDGEDYPAQDVEFVITNVGGKTLSDGTTECAFQIDTVDCLNTLGYMNIENTNIGGWRDCTRRTWCNENFYNALPKSFRQLLKLHKNKSGYGGDHSASKTYETEDYIAMRAEIEVLGQSYNSAMGEGTQVEWYRTTSNRIKNCGEMIDMSYYFRSADVFATYEASYQHFESSDIGSHQFAHGAMKDGIAVFAVI